MATLGELVVNLIAKTAPFESGMRRARGAIADTKTSVEVMGGAIDQSIKRLGSWVLGFVSVRAAVRGVASEMSRLDDLIKLADRTGVNFEGLQGLAFGADLSGVGISEFSSAIEQYASRVGKGAYASSRAAKAVDALGLSFDSLLKMDVADQIGMIADRLNSLPEAELKVSLARDLFGDTAILTFLQEGSKGIERLAKRAEKLGLVIDRIDAENIVRANDALSEFNKRIKSIATIIVTEIAPGLVEGTTWLQSAITAHAKGAKYAAFAITARLHGADNATIMRMIAEEYGPEIVSVTTRQERDTAFARRRAGATLLNRFAGGISSAVVRGTGLVTSAIDAGAKQVDPMIPAMKAVMASATLLNTFTTFGRIAAGATEGIDLVSKWQEGFGGSQDTGAARTGERARIEANAQRDREKQLKIEEQQLAKLQEMAKAMLDPSRIMAIIQTSVL